MKKNLLYGLMASVAAIAMSGCADDFNPAGSGEGRIAVMVNVDTDVARFTPRGRASNPTLDDLTLRLVSKDREESRTWVSDQNSSAIDKFNSEPHFKVGQYTLEAYCGDLAGEGLDGEDGVTPYYYGCADITVSENKDESANLTVGLAHTMISVAPTDAFKAYFGEGARFDVKSSESTTTVSFPVTETRPAYVKPGSVELYANIVNPSDNKSARVLAATLDAKAKTHYTVAVDVNKGSTGGSGVGTATMTISFSDELNETVTIDIELNDELFAVSSPIMTVKGYDALADYSFVEGSAPADLAPNIFINAPGQIASVVMASDNPWLLAQGIPAEVELVGASADLQEKLAAAGISVKSLYKNADRVAYIDLAGLISKVRYVDGQDNANKGVAFVVKDKSVPAKTSEPIAVKFTVAKLEANLLVDENTLMALGDTGVTVNVDYSGDNIMNDLTAQYYNKRGTWSDATILSANPVSRSMNTYTVEIGGMTDLPDTGAVKLRLLIGERVCSEVEIKRPRSIDLTVSCDERDIYAKSAILTVASTDVDSAFGNEVNIFLSTDAGKSYPATPTAATVSGNNLTLTGLTPATAYKAKVVLNKTFADGDVGAAIRYVTFTTEAATQLPNANLDSWYVSNSGDNWQLQVPMPDGNTAGWSTLNALTTSPGGSWNTNISYVTLSGTIPTDDAVSGKAALIRTVAWGAGQTNAGSMSTIKNVTQGELFLGTYDGGPVYGLGFASRPASVSFQTKYSPKNSADKGYAEVNVLDASGNVIATNNMAIDAASSYSKQTLTLSYGAKAAKAAKIQVIFRSTNAGSTYLNKSNLDFKRSGHTGSQLYIDDISLNY